MNSTVVLTIKELVCFCKGRSLAVFPSGGNTVSNFFELSPTCGQAKNKRPVNHHFPLSSPLHPPSTLLRCTVSRLECLLRPFSLSDDGVERARSNERDRRDASPGSRVLGLGTRPEARGEVTSGL